LTTSSSELVQGEPVLRHAARVLLIDAEGRVLLLKWRLQDGRHIWITPGGGLGAGESHPEAALRELDEEVGLRDIPLGPCVWLREHVFNWNGRAYRQRERFYLVRVDAHVVDRSGNDENELQVLEEFRWWTLPELAASTETFAPSRIAFFLAPLLAGELPSYPIDVGG
jgi:8-oxo-dGTP pyrophosphatase MutT (NUDIX family)